MLTRVTCCSKETKPIVVELLLIGSLLEKNCSGPVSEDLHRQGLCKRRVRGKKTPKHHCLGTKGEITFFLAIWSKAIMDVKYPPAAFKKHNLITRDTVSTRVQNRTPFKNHQKGNRVPN